VYNGYRVTYPGIKRPGLDVDHTSLSSTEVKELVDLYLYFFFFFFRLYNFNLSRFWSSQHIISNYYDPIPQVPL
jgi:hypothetical protein